MKRQSNEGFVLPMVIFAMVIAAVLVTGTTFMAHQETRIGSAVQRGAAAFYLAERGIAEVLVNWDAAASLAMPPGADTTLTDTLSTGITSTKVTRLSNRLFLLESSSTITEGGAILSGAARDVGLVVRLFTADIPLPAALTTRGPTELRGNSEVHGEDAVPPGWGAYCYGTPSDKPGIMTDDSTGVTTSGASVITGVPLVQEDTTISAATFTQFGDLSWADLVEMANITVPGGTFSQAGPVVSGGECVTSEYMNWGSPTDPTGPCGNYFPIIHVAGNARIQAGGEGQGVLLVDGNIELRGNFVFHGIIVVQGTFETQGNGNRVFGGVLAGNATLESQVVTGGSEITNSSCATNRAILNSGLTKPRPLGARSWVDLSAVGR